MNNIRKFFDSIDFSFDSDIKHKNISIPENSKLLQNIKNNIFVYDSPKNANTSFFLISEPITNEELFEIKRYFWNENKYELYFRTDAKNIKLCYAKNSPREKEIELDTFKLTELEEAEIEKIKKWKFESGAFWMDYVDALYKVKKNQSIDTKLINQLKLLKKELKQTLIESDNNIVQALIDRMLFIKFLEDNHIINSYFYKHFFNNKNLTYKQLLENSDSKKINLLYSKINDLFSNRLFETPIIEEQYINKTSNLIYKAIKQDDFITGQLSLFDFRFDIIPIEFISHIYEVFLEDDQADEGIFYTPPKLAQLITDDVIAKQGKVLDPACGSGMFLILAFRRLLKIKSIDDNASVSEKISYKINILKKNIFGIEKENTAWRLTIFSLYLEILKGLPNKDIKKYIKDRIEKEDDIKIFPDFSQNIINGNSLEVKKENLHFVNQTFDYIVGNPPFLKIPPDAKEHKKEREFTNNYSSEINGKIFKAKNVVSSQQLSQAFMLKIKDWANKNTKFGFVLNSSNFYNEKSDKFQEFFFESYQVENFYEFSRVKNILFSAGESVVVAIFNNKKIENNTLNYYPVDLEPFSKTFDLLIIQEDKKIEILQKDILSKSVILRDYLIGNEFDLNLIERLRKNDKLENYLLHLEDSKDKVNNGLQIVGKEQLIEEFGISEKWKILNKKERKKYSDEFKLKYTRGKKDKKFNTPLILPENLLSFQVTDIETFLGNISNFHRSRNPKIYDGNKILINRVGSKLKAVFFKEKIYYNFDVYSIFLANDNFYHIITAIINSDLINYLINIIYRKRSNGSFPKIGYDAIKNIPIPKELDKNLVAEISEISQQLIKGKLKYEDETKEKLNELIYDLYDLSYLERQRIKDFFSTKQQADQNDLEEYKIALYETLEMYFEKKPEIKFYNDNDFGFNLRVAAVYFNDSYKKMPSEKKVFKYRMHEILKETDQKFLVMREKIFGNNCVYIIKNKHFKNWSETKGFEDGKYILKKMS